VSLCQKKLRHPYPVRIICGPLEETMPPLLVTAAIIRQKNLILITLRPEGSRYAGLWEFPGGKIEENESPEQCLEREIFEELGVRAAVGDVFGSTFHKYPWGNILLLAYNCRLLDGPIRNLGVAEHRWVTSEQLDTYPMLPADLPLIEKLQNLAESASRPSAVEPGAFHKT